MKAPVKQTLKEWSQRLSEELEWSRVDKGLLLLVALIPLFTQYFIWSLYVLNRPDRDQLVHVDVVYTVMQLEVALVALSTLIVLVGLYLRRKKPDLLAFQYVSLQFFSLTLVLMSYSIGTVSFPAGLVLLGAPVYGLILLDRKAVWWATGTALFTLLILSYATVYDLLPYAPVVVPPVSHSSKLFWMNSSYFFAAPFFILILARADQILTWWREREERIRRLSRTDALTGIHNRHSILEILDREINRAERSRTALSLVILDLDHFKKVNDTWGHPTGDLVLKTTAEVLGTHIRQGDALGRYGGEEFLMVLPGATQDEAMKVVERCRLQLADAEIINEQGKHLRVTASFGLVSMENFVIASHHLIKSADEALYQAKHNGRNRVEVATIEADVIVEIAEVPEPASNCLLPKLSPDWSQSQRHSEG